MSQNTNNKNRNPETGESYRRRPHQEERYKNMSSDKKREVRTEERQHKKDMKRSMNYFQHVGEVLKEADSDMAHHVVEGFSTELIRKLRADFSLLYKSSTICKVIEKALSSGASRAHVDALFYIFSGHIRGLLSVPKTSFLVETLFTAIYHSVGLECEQRGGPSYLDDVLETPSAASTPSLKQLLENFVDEICHEFSGMGIDWLYTRSAARGFASIIKSLAGIPSRNAPKHEGIHFSFAIAPISRALKRSFFKSQNDTLEAALDPAMTFVIQALLKCPLVAETWLRDLTTKESITQLLQRESGVRVLEAAMEANSSMVTPLVLSGFVEHQKEEANESQKKKTSKKSKKNEDDADQNQNGDEEGQQQEEAQTMSANSLFIIANVISNTESHTEVLELWKNIIKPKLVAAISSGREYSALAKAVKRIAMIQGSGLPKSSKDIRTDIVHDVVEACKVSHDQLNKDNKDAKKNPLLQLFYHVSFDPQQQQQQQQLQADQSPEQLQAKRLEENANFKAGTSALEFLDSLLHLGLGPAGMIVHAWEKIPVEKLRQMACCNIGSRALQLLVPHIASQRLTGKQITNPQDAVIEDVLDTVAEEARKKQKEEEEEAKKAQQKAERYANRKNSRNPNGPQQVPIVPGKQNQQANQPPQFPQQQQQSQLPYDMVLQPNLQKLLKRLTNSEIGDGKGRATEFPTFASLICNSFAAFLIQRIYDECALWLKTMIVRRVAKLMENEEGPVKTNLAAKKFALHIHVDQFIHRPSEWRLEAERTSGVKKLMSVILAAES